MRAGQLAFAFDSPSEITVVQPRECWMEECRCSGRGGSEHEEWFWIRWYLKHLYRGADAKYLANVRHWVYTARHGWGGTFN